MLRPLDSQGLEGVEVGQVGRGINRSVGWQIVIQLLQSYLYYPIHSNNLYKRSSYSAGQGYFSCLFMAHFYGSFF